MKRSLLFICVVLIASLAFAEWGNYTPQQKTEFRTWIKAQGTQNTVPLMRAANNATYALTNWVETVSNTTYQLEVDFTNMLARANISPPISPNDMLAIRAKFKTAFENAMDAGNTTKVLRLIEAQADLRTLRELLGRRIYAATLAQPTYPVNMRKWILIKPSPATIMGIGKVTGNDVEAALR